MEDDGCPTVFRLAKHAALRLSHHFNNLITVELISMQAVNNG